MRLRRFRHKPQVTIHIAAHGDGAVWWATQGEHIVTADPDIQQHIDTLAMMCRGKRRTAGFLA